MKKPAYVYILTNKNDTIFYTGVTSDLQKRIWEHKQKIFKNSFTDKYNLDKLVYFEIHSDITEAIKREKYIKGKKRQFKLDLIEKENSKYRDLSEDWE